MRSFQSISHKPAGKHILSRAALFLLQLGLLAATACSPTEFPTFSSYYVPMQDGTRLAVDVHLPVSREPGDEFPALLELTRYGRSREGTESGVHMPSLGPLDRYFLEHGYAVVKVDARGSGASFGTRPVEYGPDEVRDGYYVVDWVRRQGWSDGKVGAYGTSYSGTTAELLTAVNHPAVKAVIPGWSDFDVYASPVRPYGLAASSFISAWSSFVGNLDENDVEALGSSIRRVAEDTAGTLLAQALEEHAANPDVFEVVSHAVFRDDTVAGGYTYVHSSPLYWKDEIERSRVPMLVFASWHDAGTADGALLRFQHFSNRQHVIIMASSHGGGSHASPYTVRTRPLPPDPPVEEQLELRLAFFDHYLRGEDNGVDVWPRLRFYNLGEEEFHESGRWPPRGTSTQSFYLGARSTLTTEAPSDASGSDQYRVDPEVTTGSRNRWNTQFGGAPVLALHSRGGMDARMLSYTSAPLEEDLQISGWPVVTLQVASDQPDGMVLAYLEDVDENGESRYVTEGGLRLIHRKVSPNPYFEHSAPYHSFARADAQQMVPGEVAEVSFQLWPISVLIRQGHRLRLAIAGADAHTFDPLPAEGNATLTVHRNASNVSLLELPVVEGGLGN
jgi:putative CocE/NonD family hydrolase